jgi:protein phosphatase
MDVGKKLRIAVTCATHKGSRRLNEDSYLALVGDSAPCGTLGLLAVADGIGGLGTGETASKLAVKTLADVFSASCSIANSTRSDVPHLLRFAVQKANAAVFQTQLDNKDLQGMGTTCVAAAVTSDVVHIVSIGDSRAYLFHKRDLIPLTVDEWIKRSDGITAVNQAIGWQPLLPTEPASHKIDENDLLLLCTDGLTDGLPEESMIKILSTGETEKACATLAQAVGERPDSDNVTVVVARLVRE